MNNITFHRNQLYKKVWSKPVSNLSKELGITSYQLYKVCKELNIPTPGSGYWAKLRHNKKVDKPGLPESGKVIFVLKFNDKSKTSNSNNSSPGKKKITVAKRLTSPHPLVKRAKEDIDINSLNRFNRVRGGRPLDISVSPDNIKRGLRIFDAVIKEIEKRGYSVRTELHNSSYWNYITISKDKVYFQLREEGTRRKRTEEEKENSWDYEFEYNPTGKLKFLLLENRWHSSGRVLSDTKSKILEERLDEFFFKLESMAKKLKENRLKREEYNRKLELERQIEEAIETQIKSENKQLEVLEEKAKAFTKSQYIYDFIEEVEKQLSLPDLNKEDKLKLKAWIIWAQNHADRLNPVKQMVKEIMDHTEEPLS